MTQISEYFILFILDYYFIAFVFFLETAMGISLNEDAEDVKQYVNDIKRFTLLFFTPV